LFRSENEESLKDERSDLYCFLFDSSCNNGNRSIFEVLSGSRIAIHISDFGPSREDGVRYAMVFYYDASVISPRQLSSRSVLCREQGERIVGWLFRMDSGRWIGANQPFDAET